MGANQDDRKIGGAEFGQGLTAEPAGGRRGSGIGADNQAAEVAVAQFDRLKESNPLGTDSGAIAGILNVATGKDSAIGGFEGAAHGVLRVGAISARLCLASLFEQSHMRGRMPRRSLENCSRT
jgi:hypothetical protein